MEISKYWLMLLLCTWLGETLVTACPKGCICQHYNVDCRGQNLTEIPTDIPISTRILHIEGNRIRELTEESFQNLENLDILGLGGNEIMTLKKSPFQKLIKLTHLYLDNNLLTGDDFKSATFMGLDALVVMNLSHNPIATLNDGSFQFEYLTSLQTLDLSYNDLQHISPNAFTDIHQLTTLYLNDNHLDDITHIFKGLKKLQTLNCSSNQITMIGKGDMYDLRDLQFFDIGTNKLSVIEEDAFSELQKLTFLDLRENRLTTVPTDNLKYLSSLVILDLDTNPIKEITTGAVPIPSLEDLFINNMPVLSTIKNGSFAQLKNLQRAFIANNPKLSNIHPSAFNVTPSKDSAMSTIDLRNNSLRTLDKTLLNWNSMHEIQVGANPWNCDCNIEWMIESLPDDQSHFQYDLKCDAPKRLLGQLVQSLESEDFICPVAPITAYMGGMITSIVVISIVALVAIVGFIIFKCRYRFKCCFTRPGDYHRVMYDIYDAMEPEGVIVTPASEYKDKIIAKNERKSLKDAVEV
ncbi:unnamed protein product [Owenia fusiformis]|uniref:Uncharacterized protein n=1 Tax=Owenia fusiformis TaxID=6347 RepID=A0A8J1TX44_OWEFU|nr:unnamed protein product [Owenia fusiformis]